MGETEQYILAQYDEFKAVQDSDGWVSILDGENTVRVVMDFEMWERFIEDALRRGTII